MQELIGDIRAIERAFAARLITPSIAAIKQHFDNASPFAPTSTKSPNTC